MQVTLLVPDLFWPREDGGDAYRELKLPRLEWLLARSRRSGFPAVSTEAWLCQAFEVERQQDWPVAPITLAFDGGKVENHYWLRADPVHLAAHRDRLTLIDAPTLKPGADDAAELVTLLNRHFSDDQLEFCAPHPARWYLRVPGTPRLVTRELSQAAGRDIATAMPSGADSARWRSTLNEIQMLLHDHPVNQRRESRGEPAINSVWLWGGGRRASVPGQHFTHVAGNDALALALAARVGVEGTTLAVALGGQRDADASTRLLVVAETAAARHGDDGAWRQGLLAMERDWIAPLHDALRRRFLERIEIVALHPRGCERFEVTTRDLLKFWRLVRPLATHAPTGN